MMRKWRRKRVKRKRAKKVKRKRAKKVKRKRAKKVIRKKPKKVKRKRMGGALKVLRKQISNRKVVVRGLMVKLLGRRQPYLYHPLLKRTVAGRR